MLIPKAFNTGLVGPPRALSGLAFSSANNVVGFVNVTSVNKRSPYPRLNHFKPGLMIRFRGLGVVLGAAIGGDCHGEVLRFVVNYTPKSAFLRSAFASQAR